MDGISNNAHVPWLWLLLPLSLPLPLPLQKWILFIRLATPAKKFNEIRNLVKFKISSQKLMIGLGRYQIGHLPRENRLCLLCKLNQVEIGTNFLFHSA